MESINRIAVVFRLCPVATMRQFLDAVARRVLASLPQDIILQDVIIL